MPKNIAFFADGTWNGPGEDEETADTSTVTNVLKLYSNLAGFPTIETLRLDSEQERVARGPDGAVVQVAKYVHGVGDSRNFFARFMGGSFGSGIIERIVRGYTFVSRNYAPGDRIFLVGFSRGAYTARALGGMIAAVGLLDATKLDGLQDKSQAYRYGLTAWRDYREKAGQDPNLTERWVLGEREAIPPDAMVPDVAIRAIGVWDTVGALGIPRYSDEHRLDIFRFTDASLSRKVARGFHALAIDEARADFEPTPWGPRDDGSIEQVWFTGAHADIGGGYPVCESGLSDQALRWMSERLADAGLQVDRFGSYVIEKREMRIHRPWTEGVWKVRKPQARTPGDAPVFHRSVAQWLQDNDDYRGGVLGPYLVGGSLPDRLLAPGVGVMARARPDARTPAPVAA